jgi:site-specific recombinase XerD
LLNLRISDVQRGCSFEIIGKGGKSRLVNINPELREDILAYVDFVSFRSGIRFFSRKFDNDFVFISHASNTF